MSTRSSTHKYFFITNHHFCKCIFNNDGFVHLPVAAGKNLTTSGSTLYRGPGSSFGQTRQWTLHPHLLRLYSLLLSCTLPKSLVWKFRKTLLLTLTLPILLLGKHQQPNNIPPSLHHHHSGFITTTGDSALETFALVFFLVGATYLSFPLTSKVRFPRSVLKPIPSSCHLYTDYRLNSKQVSFRLVLRKTIALSFDSILRD